MAIDRITANGISDGTITAAKVAADMATQAEIDAKLNLTGGTLTGTLTMESTDAGSAAAPELILYRNSASPADADYLGQIQFKGENDNGGSEIYAKVTGKITDASNGTEDGLIETAIKGNGSFTIVSRQKSNELQLLNGVNLDVAGNIVVGGTVDGVDIQTLNTTAGAALPKAGGTMTGNISHAGAFTIDTVGDISLDSEGAILIKNGGSAIGRISNSGSDMIIKSDTSDKDILFKGNDGGSTIEAMRIDMSSAGLVGIGESAPQARLHVKNQDAGSFTVNSAADDLIVEAQNAGISIISLDAGDSSLIFGSPSDPAGAQAKWNHNANSLYFRTSKTNAKFILGGGNGLNTMTLDGAGQVGMGITPSANTSVLTIGAAGNGPFQAGIDFDDTNSGNTHRVYNNNGDLFFRDATAGLTRLVIKANGNIGINETEPIRKFVIAGPSGNGSTLLMHMDADTAGGECGIEFKADSTNDNRRVKAAIKYRRDDPGTRGTGNLHFCVNGDNNDVNVSTAHTRMMLNTDGLHFNGDTAAANALDDYEEGTWSPRISTTSGGSSMTYSGSTTGHYRKIGGLVQVFGILQLTAKGNLQAGNVFVHNFPFSMANVAGEGQGGPITEFGGFSVNFTGPILAFYQSGRMYIRHTTTNGGSTYSHVSGNDVGNSTYFRFNATYTT